MERADRILKKYGASADGLTRYGNRYDSIRKIEVLPGIFELDDTFEGFKDELMRKLTSLEAAHIDEETTALTGSALLPDSFSGLASLQGVSPHPHGYPPSEIIAKHGTIDGEDIDIYSRIVKHYLSGFTLSSSFVKRTSSSGWPFHSNNLMLKQRVITDLFNLLIEHGFDFDVFMEEFPNISTLGQRMQQDQLGKIREVFDFYGKLVEADKKRNVPKHLRDIRDAGRLRLVYAFPLSNIVIAILLNGFRHHALNTVSPDVLHHSVDWASKINGKRHITGMDFKQYDMSVPPLFIEIFYEELGRRLGSKNLAEYVMSYDVYYPNFNERESKLYSHRELHGEVNVGNPSGHAAVSDVAKCGALYASAKALLLSGCVQEPEEVFKHTHDYAILNSGDDTLAAFSERRNKEAYSENMNSSIFDVNPEIPAKFIGWFLYVKDANAEMKFIPDLASLVLKTFTPEYSYYTRDLKLSIVAKEQYYAAHPSFDLVYGIMNDTFSQVYGSDIRTYIFENTPDNPIVDDVEFINLNESELIFIDNPDSIQYKVNPDDIREELLDRYYLTYTTDMINELLGKLNSEVYDASYIPRDRVGSGSSVPAEGDNPQISDALPDDTFIED